MVPDNQQEIAFSYANRFSLSNANVTLPTLQPKPAQKHLKLQSGLQLAWTATERKLVSVPLAVEQAVGLPLLSCRNAGRPGASDNTIGRGAGAGYYGRIYTLFLVEVAVLRPLPKVGQASRLPGERFSASSVSAFGGSGRAAATTAASEAIGRRNWLDYGTLPFF